MFSWAFQNSKFQVFCFNFNLNLIALLISFSLPTVLPASLHTPPTAGVGGKFPVKVSERSRHSNPIEWRVWGNWPTIFLTLSKGKESSISDFTKIKLHTLKASWVDFSFPARQRIRSFLWLLRNRGSDNFMKTPTGSWKGGLNENHRKVPFHSRDLCQSFYFIKLLGSH